MNPYGQFEMDMNGRLDLGPVVPTQRDGQDDMSRRPGRLEKPRWRRPRRRVSTSTQSATSEVVFGQARVPQELPGRG